jgi:hypothetical protein
LSAASCGYPELLAEGAAAVLCAGAADVLLLLVLVLAHPASASAAMTMAPNQIC